MSRPRCVICNTRETRRNVRLRPVADGCSGVHDYFACDICEDARTPRYNTDLIEFLDSLDDGLGW